MLIRKLAYSLTMFTFWAMSCFAQADFKSDSDSAAFNGILRWENQEYYSNPTDAPGLSSARLLSARMNLRKDFGTWQAEGDFVGGTFFSRGQSYLLLPQAYVDYQFTNRDGFMVGRKHLPWSHMDSFWALGLWQPTFYIDGLRPEVLGLTGFFYDRDVDDNWGYTLLFSPIYIPSLGPDIKESNGVLQTESRWYRTPTRAATIFSINHEIDYTLNRPSQNQIVMNQVIAGQVRVGDMDHGSWLVLSAAQKPVNELSYKYSVSLLPNSRGSAVISPTVAYNRIWSMDVGYTINHSKVIISYLRDYPQQMLAEEENFIQQNLRGLSIVSIYVGQPLFILVEKSLLFEFSYMRASGGETYDLRNDGSLNEFNILGNRLKFTHSLALRLSGELGELVQKPVNMAFKYLYDYEQDGSIYNFEWVMLFPEQFGLIFGLDILGVANDSSTSLGFINQFRANDRYYGGMSYVF